MVKRVFDFSLATVIGLFLFFPFLVLCLAVKLTSRGPIFHLSKRIGKNNQLFLMPKIRTMRMNTPQVATHLLENPESFLTPIGSFLRKSSLDELPQIISVLKGDMSFVGPRPALFNQDDLVALRTKSGIETLKPGITGWAQVNGRDELPIPVKVEFDRHYLNNQSFLFDLKILVLTAGKVFRGDGVKH